MQRWIPIVLLLTLAACGGGGGPTTPTVAPTSAIALSGNLDFGNVLVGTSWNATLTISNSGNTALTVTSITGPSGFTASFTSGTIAAGSSQAVTIGFTPSAPGDYSGTVTVIGNQSSGTNTIKISAMALPSMNGAWSGTSVSSAALSSGTCNMSWIVSGQTAAQFSGTWQTSGSSCGQAGTFSGTVTIDNAVRGVSFSALVGVTGCTRIAGDGLFNGVLSSAVATLQSADTIRCPGISDITRSMTVSMRKQ